jgi:hypothetical protein
MKDLVDEMMSVAPHAIADVKAAVWKYGNT